MPTFVFTSPEGKEYEITGPEGATQQQAWEQLQRQLKAKPAGPTEQELGGKAYQFARGVVQGAVFDPIEGIGQLIEHARGKKIPIPEGVRNWFDKVRERTEATGTGTAGRITGTLGSLALAPEAAVARIGGVRAMTQLAAPVGTAAKLARRKQYAQALGKRTWDLTPAERASSDLGHMPGPAPTRTGRVARQAAVGAAAGAAQPVEGDEGDFAAKKAFQALAGGSLAGLAGTALGKTAFKHVGRHPYHYWHWPGIAALIHPHTALPSLAGAAAGAGVLGAQVGLEKLGPRVAAPLGAAVGRTVTGGGEEEQPNAEAD